MKNGPRLGGHHERNTVSPPPAEMDLRPTVEILATRLRTVVGTPHADGKRGFPPVQHEKPVYKAS